MDLEDDEGTGTMTNYVKEIAYNTKGQRLLLALGNDIMTRYVYNENTFRLERLKSEKYSYSVDGSGNRTYTPQSGTTKQDNAYEYDLAGNILKIKNKTPDCGISGSVLGVDALDRAFSYDPLYRLLTATGRESTSQSDSYLWNDAPAPGTPNANNARGYTRSYEYDKMGNIQEITHATTNNNFTRNFNYNTGKNTSTSIDDGQDPATDYSTFSFDVNGNMITSNTTRNYEWDHSDQMRAYFNQTGTSEPSVYAHYVYDAGGNRIKKLVRTQGGDYEVICYIDGIFEYHKKVSGANTYEKNELHIMDDTSRIAMKRIGTAFPDDIADAEVYILEDHLGSSSVRLNSSGTLIDREEYYPFGDSSLRTFSKKRYRYTGKEKDSESGLYYYGARYYAAWTGRFISVDALAGMYPHLNSFHYGANNPIVLIDIDGNQIDQPSRDDSGKKEIKTNQNENKDPKDDEPLLGKIFKAWWHLRASIEKLFGGEGKIITTRYDDGTRMKGRGRGYGTYSLPTKKEYFRTAETETEVPEGKSVKTEKIGNIQLHDEVYNISLGDKGGENIIHFDGGSKKGNGDSIRVEDGNGNVIYSTRMDEKVKSYKVPEGVKKLNITISPDPTREDIQFYDESIRIHGRRGEPGGVDWTTPTDAGPQSRVIVENRGEERVGYVKKTKIFGVYFPTKKKLVPKKLEEKIKSINQGIPFIKRHNNLIR